MSTTNNGGPAFPVPQQSFGNGIVLECKADGMSLRDWFAGMALSSLASSEDEYGTTRTVEERGQWMYDQADAALAARERKEPS